jgi:hypothetical protein
MRKFAISALLFSAFALNAGFAAAQTSRDKAATIPAAKKNVSTEQVARLAEKAERIRQILNAAEPDMQAKHISAENRRWLVESLYQMPLTQIRSIGPTGTFSGAVNAVTHSKAMLTPKALGDTNQDLVYKPFVPCRYIDTRNPPLSGKISSPQGFDISQSGSSYGGIAACDPLTLIGGVIDDNSVGGLAMNVTIFDTSSAAPPGFLAVRPAGSTNVTSLLNWYVQGPFVQDANYAIITMDQSPAVNEFEILASAPVHVIVDLFGAFVAPNATALDCVTLYNSSATSVPAGGENCANPPACPASYTVTSPLFSKGGANDGLVVSQINLNLPGLQVCGRATLGPASFTAGVQCCRVPGR